MPACLALWLASAGSLFATAAITSFSPTMGSPGDQIMLSGSGFTTGSYSVYFWQNKVVTAGTVLSDTQLKITVPSGTTTGPIGILPSGGSIIYTADDFLAVGGGPYISDFSPGFGAVNDAITINGVHFTNNPPTTQPVVKFNGVTSTSVSVSSDGTLITARVPSGATNGLISVTTTVGTGSSTNSPFLVIGAGPYVTDFSPFGGSAGVTITIDGVHFSSATNATFNGVAGTGFTVRSDTLLQVTVPSGVTTGPIRINSPLGGYTTTSNFFVPPSITSFTPSSGRPGTNVTITGVNFTGATAVTFNGLPASSFSVLNNTSIRAIVPAGVTDGVIRINTPLYSCFSPNSFLVQPTMFGFSPLFGPVGTSVTINGTNLNVGTVTVKFNGVQAAPPTGVTSGHLTAVVPAGATTGPIMVTTGDGSATSTNNFMLPATISSFSPNFGPAGTRVMISGENFVGATGVSFNGQAGTGLVVTNNTTLGVSAPGGIVSGPISVTTPVNTATSAAVFYGVPGITNFTPTHGTNGTVVTIRGTNFLGATAVRFNGLNASINSNDGNQIATSVPIGAQSGPLSVVAPAGTNTTTAIFTVDRPSEMQIWGTASSDPQTLGSNLTYTITIVNYGPNDAPNVRLTNWLPASVTLRSATINQGTLNTNANPITGNMGTMVWGAAATFTVTVVPHALGSITNTMSIVSDNPDPLPDNNTSAITTLIQSPPLLSIALATNRVNLSWAADLTNYSLQARNSLLSNVYWSNVSTAPIISTNLITVTESPSTNARVYRLKR
jgi:uncharacterized repeat protein (TIGR01451 family)